MSDLIQYEELAQRHEAAYTAFKSIYVSKNPPPQSEITKKFLGILPSGIDWLTVFSLGGLVISSVVVSGSRTINEFGGGPVGVAAFVMLEVALITYAYSRTKKHFDEARYASVKRLKTIGMWLAFAVTLVANLHATLKHNGVYMADWLNIVILVLIAISAPSLALIAGDILGMEAVSGERIRRKAKESYDTAYREWLDGMNRSWASQQSRWGVRVEILPSQYVPRLMSHETGQDEAGARRSGYGYQRTADGETQVMDYFRLHPEDVSLPVRELETRIGVSKSTISRARRKYIGQGAATE